MRVMHTGEIVKGNWVVDCGETEPRFVLERERIDRATCEECLKKNGVQLAGRFIFSDAGKIYKNMTWWCPGCDRPHVARVRVGGGGSGYLDSHEWNGSETAPTLIPCWFELEGSGKVESYDDDYDPGADLCHCYVRGGSLEFVQGTHALVEQPGTVRPPIFAEAEKAARNKHKAKAAMAARERKAKADQDEKEAKIRVDNAAEWLAKQG